MIFMSWEKIEVADTRHIVDDDAMLLDLLLGIFKG